MRLSWDKEFPVLISPGSLRFAHGDEESLSSLKHRNMHFVRPFENFLLHVHATGQRNTTVNNWRKKEIFERLGVESHTSKVVVFVTRRKICGSKLHCDLCRELDRNCERNHAGTRKARRAFRCCKRI